MTVSNRSRRFSRTDWSRPHAKSGSLPIRIYTHRVLEFASRGVSHEVNGCAAHSSPLYMVSLLLFHDAVELFLALASEHLGAGKTGQEFLAYWEAINQKLPSKDFGQKDSMNRLNKARGNWKHGGILVATTEINDFRINVADFFRENTPKVFGISYEEISTAALVQSKEVRDHLLEAEQLYGSGDIKAALKETAIAFLSLSERFEWGIIDQNSFHLRDVSSLRSTNIERQAPRDLSRFASEIEKEINRLRKQIGLLSLGVDYRSYMRFQQLTPIVAHMMSGSYQILGNGSGQSSQDYLFCYHFVIECALRFQEVIHFPSPEVRGV
jgi:hypothetical protein